MKKIIILLQLLLLTHFASCATKNSKNKSESKASPTHWPMPGKNF